MYKDSEESGGFCGSDSSPYPGVRVIATARADHSGVRVPGQISLCRATLTLCGDHGTPAKTGHRLGSPLHTQEGWGEGASRCFVWKMGWSCQHQAGPTRGAAAIPPGSAGPPPKRRAIPYGWPWPQLLPAPCPLPSPSLEPLLPCPPLFLPALPMLCNARFHPCCNLGH